MISVTLPSGNSHGWGICGKYLSEGLAAKGVQVLNSKPRIGYDVVPGILLQAVSGYSFGLTTSAIGELNFGYGFIEDNILARKFIPMASRLWDVIIPGSRWMSDSLGSSRCSSAEYPVIQGVDPKYYHYDDYASPDPDYFTVGSFGKFEFRKGQDIVATAMSIFRERHKDTRLLFAWKNLWPESVRMMSWIDRALVKVPYYEDLGMYVGDTVFRGVLDGLKVPYISVADTYEGMAKYYRMCDVALFPNRCEAGTNLPFHEALACGVPCIVTDATGHRDLTLRLDYPNPELLLRGGKNFVHSISGIDYGEWHEPCLDEILSHLEMAYRNKGAVNRKKIADFGGQFTWDLTTENMYRALSY